MKNQITPKEVDGKPKHNDNNGALTYSTGMTGNDLDLKEKK